MYEMYNEVVLPRMTSEMGLGQQRWYYKNLRLFGIGESDVEALIPDLIARQREPIVGITVSKATINLRIATLAGTQAEADLKMQSTVEEIEEHLSAYIYGKDEDEPWDAVVAMLTARGLKLQVHEYGEASVLGPFITAAASKQSAISTVAAVSWTANRPQVVASEIPLSILLGPYPKIHSSMEFGGDFVIELYEGGKLVHQRVQPISGHPDIILHRLAKTGAKTLLEYFVSS